MPQIIVSGRGPDTELWDTDHDTGIQVEKTADDDTVRIDVAGTEYVNITAGTSLFTNKLAINASDTMTVNGIAISTAAQIHQEGDGTTSELEVHRHNSTSSTGAVMYSARSRGTETTPLVVSSGDRIMTLAAAGYDGTDYALSSRIDLEVDGTPGNDDMPGRIIFKTSADGAQSPTEALRINASQNLLIGSTDGTDADIILGSDGGAIFNEQSNDADFRIEGNNATHLLFVDGGNNAVGFNTDDPTFTRNGGAKSSVFGVLKDDTNLSQNGYFALSSNTQARSCDVSFLKTTGTWSSKTTLANNDVIANLGFEGHDGTDFIRSSMIRATVDGTVSTDTMPIELTFHATTTDGGGPARVRMRSNGAVNFGGARTTPEIVFDSTTGSAVFNEQGNSTGSFRIEGDSDPNLFITNPTTEGIAMRTNTFQYAIDGVNYSPTLSMKRPDSGIGLNQALVSDSNTASRGAFNQFLRSRNTTGTPAATVSGDSIGIFRGSAHDGSQYITASQIQFDINGTVSTGVVPGQISFFTMNTAGAFSRKMRITPDGKTIVGTSAAPDSTLEVQGSFGSATTQLNAATLTLDDTMSTIYVDYTATGAVTITLPSAASAYNGAGLVGRIYTIKDTGCNAGTNNITINADGSDTIITDTTGNTSIAMIDNGASYTLQAISGSKWALI